MLHSFIGLLSRCLEDATNLNLVAIRSHETLQVLLRNNSNNSIFEMQIPYNFTTKKVTALTLFSNF